MADRRAVNKYYPPDWDPSKGSINKYNESHPLRGRASKIDEGILVVRFEMPFSIWCSGCNNHIGMGVRYNAEKSKIGSYYTTPIYKFVMKCHLCDNYFEIQTDPSKLDYTISKGARKQVRMADKDDEDQNTVLDLDSAEEAKRRVTDSMFRLEKKVEDQMKGESNLPSLIEIKTWRDKRKDDFSANQLVRSHYRTRRKTIEQTKKRDKDLLRRSSLNMKLVTPRTGDHIQAKEIISRVKVQRTTESEKLSRNKLLKTNKYIPREPGSVSTRSSKSARESRIKREL